MTSAIILPLFRAISAASPGLDSALQLAAACRNQMMPKHLSSSEMDVFLSEGEGAPHSLHTWEDSLPSPGEGQPPEAPAPHWLDPQYMGLSWRRNSIQGFEVTWAAPSHSAVLLPLLHVGALLGSEVLFSHSRYSICAIFPYVPLERVLHSPQDHPLVVQDGQLSWKQSHSSKALGSWNTLF